ncbi:MAG: hypothetical protein L0Z53_27160, partial [Acidobacteriales bacterium]|nr:hypothetical protein [Terriglobales bacterium]
LVNLYLNSVSNSYGFIDHSTTLPALVLLVLAFAPGVGEFSLDSLIRRYRKPDEQANSLLPVWPAQLILILIALSYFAGGYSKLVLGSLAWMDGNTLASYLSEPQPAHYFIAQRDASEAVAWRDGVGLVSFLYSTGQPTALGRLFGNITPAMMLLSVATVIWEFTFPIVIFVRRLLPIFLLVGIGFHLSVILTLRINGFYDYVLCYFLFVNWRWVWKLAVKYVGPRIKLFSPVPLKG